MRVYSYVFHALLALFLLAVSLVSWMSSGHNLRLGVVPWEGDALAYLLFASALVGLFSIWLAVKRILPAVFLIWSVAVLVVVVRGYFFSRYRFDRGGLTFALLFTLAALLAAVGAWIQFRKSRDKTEKRYRFESSVAL